MKVTALLTCASPSPSSILSRDCKIMLLFSCSRLPLSLEVWLWSVPCRLSSSVRFSPRRASSPAITCWVLHKMSSPDNMFDTQTLERKLFTCIYSREFFTEQGGVHYNIHTFSGLLYWVSVLIIQMIIQSGKLRYIVHDKMFFLSMHAMDWSKMRDIYNDITFKINAILLNFLF